jgi:hypothetical protein
MMTLIINKGEQPAQSLCKVVNPLSNAGRPAVFTTDPEHHVFGQITLTVVLGHLASGVTEKLLMSYMSKKFI